MGVLHWQGGEGCLTLTGWIEVSYVIDGSGGVSYVIDGSGEGCLTLLTGVERGVLRY